MNRQEGQAHKYVQQTVFAELVAEYLTFCNLAPDEIIAIVPHVSGSAQMTTTHMVIVHAANRKAEHWADHEAELLVKLEQEMLNAVDAGETLQLGG